MKYDVTDSDMCRDLMHRLIHSSTQVLPSRRCDHIQRTLLMLLPSKTAHPCVSLPEEDISGQIGMVWQEVLQGGREQEYSKG